MKSIILVTAFIFVSFIATGCDSSDPAGASIDPAAASSRIEALESAINAHSYDSYLLCLADSSSMQDSFTQDQFNTKFGSTAPYTTYDFGTVSVTGTTVTCTSTKSTGDKTYENEFTMVQEGDSWYIYTWKEDGTTVWFVPAKK